MFLNEINHVICRINLVTNYLIRFRYNTIVTMCAGEKRLWVPNWMPLTITIYILYVCTVTWFLYIHVTVTCMYVCMYVCTTLVFHDLRIKG